MSANRPLDEELRRRARRLLNGDRRTEDLDRLYLGLRGRARGFDAVREIGDFVAHRDERSKGFISQVARDVFTSVDVWSMDLRGLKASWTDIGRAAEANLRLASNALVKDGCGCGKSIAKQRVDSALEKISGGERITEAEARALTFLGNRFIWRPAFWADQLVDEFGRLLVRWRLDRGRRARRTRCGPDDTVPARFGRYAQFVHRPRRRQVWAPLRRLRQHRPLA